MNIGISLCQDRIISVCRVGQSMFNKLKRVIRRLIAQTPVKNLLWPILPNGIYVFNYHRIGDSRLTDFDRDIFSCSQDVFDQQLKVIKKHFTVANTADVARLLKTKTLDKRYALISFDDGYLDNYTLAYPTLRENQMSGIFFVPTALISGTDIPWWDEMAFILRSNVGKSVSLPGESTKTPLNQHSIDKDIRQLIYQAKRLVDFNAQDVLDHVRSQFPGTTPDNSKAHERLFMHWGQIQEMSDNGMEVGSHTINHHMLAKLTESEQRHEIEHSKEVIEKEIGVPIHALAYPIGRKHCFTDLTKRIAKESGYDLAFNNEPEYNKPPFDPFDINRISVNEDDLAKVILNSMGTQEYD